MCIDVGRPELKGSVSIVRELHVYGSVVPVKARDPTKFQHQGFGMLLMEEAERIAREEHGSTKIAVISGKERLFQDFFMINRERLACNMKHFEGNIYIMSFLYSMFLCGNFFFLKKIPFFLFALCFT